MKEYIDREALLQYIKETVVYTARPDRENLIGRGVRLVLDRIAAAPTADVAPVVHGEWIKAINCDCEMHKCSSCGARVVKGVYEYENPNLYCYRCGAKMDGGKK